MQRYWSPALPDKYAQLVNNMRCAFSRIVNGRICQVLPASPSRKPSGRSIAGAPQVSEFFIFPRNCIVQLLSPGRSPGLASCQPSNAAQTPRTTHPSTGRNPEQPSYLLLVVLS